VPPKIDWISAPETLYVLEQVNGRPINRKYLYILAKSGRLARKQLDGRTYLYSKQDAEKLRLIERKGAGNRRKDDTLKMRAIPKTEAA
jgi:hypothetical protein